MGSTAADNIKQNETVLTAIQLDIGSGMGGEQYDTESQAGDMAMEFSDFSDKAVRRGFIRKVYSIISIQLLLTMGVCMLFKEVEAIRYAMHPGIASPLFWSVLVICAIMTFGIVIAMSREKSLRRSFPTNFILLGLFTLAESVIIGMNVIPYDDDVVLIAAGCTAGIVVVLTIFAFQTKIDFTMCGGALVCVLFVFVLFGFLMAFLPYVETLHLLYAGIGVLIFSLYLVYDTQMMMGGEHKYSVSPEEYIFAALAIYLDIINLFLHIMRLVAAAKKR